MNTRIDLYAQTADFHSPKMRERIERFRAEVATWQQARAALDNKLRTIIPRPEGTQIVNGVRTDPGTPSWIGEGTFNNADAVVSVVGALRRERYAVPLAGLVLVRELESIRDASQAEWAAHVDSLKVALDKATKEATKEAAGFAGLTPSARSAHVADRTQTERQAVATASNPAPAETGAWNQYQAATVRDVLLDELRKGVAAAVR